MAQPADENRVGHQYRKAGVDLRHVAMQIDDRVERGQRNQHAQCLHAQALQHQTWTGGRHVMHGHHGEDRYTGNCAETHRANPETTHHRIEKQISPFSLVGLARRSCELVSNMRPYEAVEQCQQPRPVCCIHVIQRNSDRHKANAYTEASRGVDPLGECHPSAVIGAHRFLPDITFESVRNRRRLTEGLEFERSLVAREEYFAEGCQIITY